ncbi:MAG: hypothetical protein KatS3mg131_1719 [Candidatus Tectimicrobiota bacterium]|nr:MAG: hypothetical protein KatS3mg131_1719 [Candidatus Tectomicrobia bacterium]
MPILEYHCQACDHRFEVIVHGTQQPVCPACHSSRLQRLLSVFAVAGKHAETPSPGPCRTCGDPRGPGACALDGAGG